MKNTDPSPSYKNHDLPVNTVYAKHSDRDTEKFSKKYIHLESEHARDLKFGMYLSRVAFHDADVAILKMWG